MSNIEETEMGKALAEFLRARFPEAEIEFADGFSAEVDTEDVDGLLEELARATNRMRSRWLGWLWRLYYRPERVDPPGIRLRLVWWAESVLSKLLLRVIGWGIEGDEVEERFWKLGVVVEGATERQFSRIYMGLVALVESEGLTMGGGGGPLPEEDDDNENDDGYAGPQSD